MPGELIVRMRERTDRNGKRYYFGFPDIRATIDLDDTVILFFPEDHGGGVLRIKTKDQEQEQP